MPITADDIRELAARKESASLDFKEVDYDWSPTAKKKSNSELAKDLMAFANSLQANSGPGYILIGVQDDGTIVGVPPVSHQDDAALHQKVQGLLNKTPHFSYVPVEVDGVSVGAYEIRPGGRPYFPLKDSGSIRRHVALHRNGSSTDLASPTMILEWAREDDPDGHRRRALELRKLEAEAQVHGRLQNLGTTTSAQEAHLKLRIENLGRSAFFVDYFVWHVRWADGFYQQLKKAGKELPADYDPPRGQEPLSPGGIVPAGGHQDFEFRWKSGDAIRHLSEIGVPGFNGGWAQYLIAVPCKGELGGVATLHHPPTAFGV